MTSTWLNTFFLCTQTVTSHMTCLTSHLLYPVFVEPTFCVPHTIAMYVLIWTDLACQHISVFIVCFGLGNLFLPLVSVFWLLCDRDTFNAVVGRKHMADMQPSSSSKNQKVLRLLSFSFHHYFVIVCPQGLTAACEHLNAPTWERCLVLNTEQHTQ